MTPSWDRSEGIAASHGFFGRAGGQSGGEFAGLNVSTAVGDNPRDVEANRAAAAAALGFDRQNLRLLKQVHSHLVRTIGETSGDSLVEADAMVTRVPGLLLGILTADCTPIILGDAAAGVVGAAHAGWRGAVDGIVGNTVAAMEALGAERSRIVAAIGPTITQPNYEVGEQFQADFLALHPTGAAYFAAPAGGKPHFDLPGFVADELRRAGVTAIDRVGGCTYAEPDRYFSHRYATHQGTRTGRQIALVGLR